MDECPSVEVLRRWLSVIETPADDRIGRHVKDCEKCLGQVSLLDSKLNVPTDALRRDSPQDDFDAEAELVRVTNVVRGYIDSIPAGISEHASDLEPPMQVGGFRLHERIGKGGMGQVYRAVHCENGDSFAVKLLSNTKTLGDEFLRRFQRETKLIGTFDHPNIVQAMDAGEELGHYYIAMELVRGVDLTQVAFQNSAIAIADACEIARQAAIGLQYISDQGVTHRDIKPANLMINEQGIVKVLDLGLAAITREGHSITESGQVMGSIEYMAPEQAIDSRHVDIRADIFGLGATLFHLLTGTRPFLFRRRRYLADPHSLAEVRPPLASERRSLPSELEHVVEKMMATKPGDRFARPSECASALEPFSVGAHLSHLTVNVADARTERRRKGTSGCIANLLSVDQNDQSVIRAADQIENLLSLLSDSGLQQIARLYLEGFSPASIAERCDCSGRTVKRRLELIGKVWKSKGEL